jgi:hypothetical protein
MLSPNLHPVYTEDISLEESSPNLLLRIKQLHQNMTFDLLNGALSGINVLCVGGVLAPLWLGDDIDTWIPLHGCGGEVFGWGIPSRNFKVTHFSALKCI